MQASDLKPADTLAGKFGCKAVIYGGPGSGKTPIINTCHKPVMLACEPGLLSMKGSTVPTYEGYEASRIHEFMRWLTTSSEAKNYDTVAIDSVSQMAEIILLDHSKTIKHGLQQYGETAKDVMNIMRQLYFIKDKHTYLVAKEEIVDINGVKFRRPHYIGQQLPIAVPHLFDLILHLSKANIPNVGTTLAFRCQGSFDVVARDRSGKLNEYEPPNFSAIVEKVMKGI